MSVKNSSRLGRWWDGTAGLAVIILCSLLTVPLALFTTGGLRVAFSLGFVLFFPGYTLITALFPAKGRLEGIERLALSFGLSLAVVPLLGLILNFTPWGIRFIPILVTLLVFVLATSAAALYRRARLLPEERFEVAFSAAFSRMASGWAGQKRGDRVLTVVLLASIAATTGAVVYAVATPRTAEQFTEFYILGPGGKADDYPRQMVLGASAGVIVGVVNHEGENVTYSVEIDMNGNAVDRINGIALAAEQKWEEPVGFNATAAGSNQSVDFLLYRDANATVYRSLRLWIDVTEN